MREKLIAYVNSFFKSCESRRAEEFREELLAGCLDKFDDLIGAGTPDSDAYKSVIAGIGDVTELIAELEGAPGQAKARETVPEPPVITEPPRQEQYHAHDPHGNYAYGQANGYTAPAHVMSEKEERDEKLKKSVTQALWPIVVILYFAVSFTTRCWYITWVIFLIGAAAQNAIAMAFTPQYKQKNVTSILWLMTVVIYFIISFSSGLWGWTWIIFLAAVAAQQIIRIYYIWRK